MRRLTYANVMSSIAIFLVLGGATAVAATHLGKNSVGASQLKKNSVTSAKLKNSSVTAAKIKNGAITGSKVNLSTLGTVPSATNANHATSADTATNATNAVNAKIAETATNFSRYFATGLKKASVGQSIPLLSVGPFTFTGVCEAVGGTEYTAYVVATTDAAGSFFSSSDSEYRTGDFEPSDEAYPQAYTPESTEAEWLGEYGFSYYNEFAAASPGGNVLLHGQADSGVHVFGADCAFEIHGTNNA